MINATVTKGTGGGGGAAPTESPAHAQLPHMIQATTHHLLPPLCCNPPPPSQTVNWHCLTSRVCVIFLHMVQPVQLIPRQAATHPVSLWGSQPARKPSPGPGCVASASRWRACFWWRWLCALKANAVTLICLFVPTKSSLSVPNWHTQTPKWIQTPPNSHLLWSIYHWDAAVEAGRLSAPPLQAALWEPYGTKVVRSQKQEQLSSASSTSVIYKYRPPLCTFVLNKTKISVFY